MNSDTLTMAVGLKAALKLAILKSKLQESAMVRMQVQDFDGATPTIGALGVCDHCGKLVHEGVLHG